MSAGQPDEGTRLVPVIADPSLEQSSRSSLFFPFLEYRDNTDYTLRDVMILVLVVFCILVIIGGATGAMYGISVLASR